MIVLTFLWAVAEAIVWPIMPDALLPPLAVARPRSWWQLALAATLGSVVGGVVSYLVGRRCPDERTIATLPLIRTPMVRAASTWLEEDGPRGLRHQPFSGVPYKVFARLAGGRGMPLAPFMAWTVATRGGRSLFTIGASLAVRWCLPWLAGRWFWPAAVVWSVIFGLGLWRTVRSWGAVGAEIDDASDGRSLAAAPRGAVGTLDR